MSENLKGVASFASFEFGEADGLTDEHLRVQVRDRPCPGRDLVHRELQAMANCRHRPLL